MANDNLRVLEVVEGVEFVFNCTKFRDEIRRMSRLAKKNGIVESVEAFREEFAEKLMVSASAIKQWESGRNGVSDLERVKEIAALLLLDDYRKLLMPKSKPLEKECSVMMNRMIDENERNAARNIFAEMTEYISMFEESMGFTNFIYCFLCSESVEAAAYQVHLDMHIKQARFDLPENVYTDLKELYDNIGIGEDDSSDPFKSEDFAQYIKENYKSDLSNNLYARGVYCSRKADDYYERLCEIMSDYLK